MSLNTSAKITVIIPTLGKNATLSKLLESLQSQQCEHNFEVLIIDNSLDEIIYRKLKDLSVIFKNKIQVLSSSKRGVNHARNLGLLNCNSEIALFVDDDCWMNDKHLISKHILLHEKYPEYLAIGGYYALDADGGFIDKCYHEIQMHWLSESLITADLDDASYLIGGHCSIKTKALNDNEISFDSKIKYGGSELSLFLAARRKQLKLRLEKLYVVHNPKLTFFSLLKKQYLQGRGKAYLVDDYLQKSASFEFSEKPTILLRIVLYMCQLSFWTGYYFQRKKYFAILGHIVNQFIGAFKKKKSEIFKSIEDEIAAKKNRGDRF